MYTGKDNYTVILSLIIQKNAPLDYISTISTFKEQGNINVNIAESYRVSFNHEFRIIRVGNESPPAVRPKSAIEVIILRVLSY